MSEEGEGNVVNIYAQLDSQEMPIPKDLSDYWQDPSSYFLIPGDLRNLYLCLLLSLSATAACNCIKCETHRPGRTLELHCFKHTRLTNVHCPAHAWLIIS